MIGLGFAASFFPKPSETEPMGVVNPNDLTVDSNLKDADILDTY